MLIDLQGFALLGLCVKSPEENTEVQKRREGNRERERKCNTSVQPPLWASLLLVSRLDAHTFLPSAKRVRGWTVPARAWTPAQGLCSSGYCVNSHSNSCWPSKQPGTLQKRLQPPHPTEVPTEAQMKLLQLAPPSHLYVSSRRAGPPQTSKAITPFHCIFTSPGPSSSGSPGESAHH